MSPGHGLKGKVNAIASDDDLSKMYEEHHSKRCEIRLWCLCSTNDNSVIDSDQIKRTRGSEEDDVQPSAKRGTCQQRMQHVHDIACKLHEKHGEAFSVEKYNAWAHMIHKGKHASYDDPPPLF